MPELNRRDFVLGASTAVSAAHAAGANERIRLGIIGAGARGQWLMNFANEIGGIEWVAAADVYGRRRDEAARIARATITPYGDYRQLLERRDIDAVIIATPDHWHARMIIEAVRSGKDVFCEKPMSVTPHEGVRIVKAVNQAGRVVQIGTQQRSIPVIREARQKFIESGALGRVTMVHCYWNLNGGYILPSRIPPELLSKPEDLDWESWLGSLPKVPYDPKRFLRPFVFWGPSTGPTGNLLVHFLDVIHWYLGLRNPAAATAIGGIYHLKDGRDVPDNFSATLEYPEGVLVSYGCCVPDQARREGVDLIFMGTGGRLHVFRDGYRFIPAAATHAGEEITAVGRDGSQHMQNWLECIRTRKAPNSNVTDSHYLSAACYLANTSYFRHERAYWQDGWGLEDHDPV